jgi:predicted transcriptional regulator
MATTSLKLPDDLKERAATVARERGISTHAFLVEAIRFAATAAEQKMQFSVEAKVARARMLKSGKGHDADQVHAHLRRLAEGKRSTAPKAKSWRD